MDQPGVEVRPIKMICGDTEFNEVFFTDAKCPKENVIGEVNEGWAVAMTLLGFERGEAAATIPIAFRGEFDRLVELARSRNKTDDPVIRQRLAWCPFARSRSCASSACGPSPSSWPASTRGPTPRSPSCTGREYHRQVTELAVDILGADGLAPTGSWPSSSFHHRRPRRPNAVASWVGTFLNARAGTIYAGTCQVQRNIIGEMVLGLPKEPGPTPGRGTTSPSDPALSTTERTRRDRSEGNPHRCRSRWRSGPISGSWPFAPRPR